MASEQSSDKDERAAPAMNSRDFDAGLDAAAKACEKYELAVSEAYDNNGGEDNRGVALACAETIRALKSAVPECGSITDDFDPIEFFRKAPGYHDAIRALAAECERRGALKATALSATQPTDQMSPALREYDDAASRATWVKPAARSTSGALPSEPTEAMVKAMAECYDPTWGYPRDCGIAEKWAKRSYAAMLATVPSASGRSDG